MANYLVHPPAGGGLQTMKVNGRTYVGVPGTPLIVPDFDMRALVDNGWVSVGLTGTTAQRPAASSTGSVMVVPGTRYQDSTLSASIFWDGKVWRNEFSGASV